MSYILFGTYCKVVCWTGEAIVFDSKIRAVILFIVLLVGLLTFQILTRIKFKNKQLEYQCVKDALNEKGVMIKEFFMQKQIKYPPQTIFIRIFKEERILELWASQNKRGPFVLIKPYIISNLPGSVGPKRQEGDKQVPEGFYYIDRFNPVSKFYLSLGINYPNESDCVLGVYGSLGGNIFIHGGIDTIGCIPITDDCIKELYIIAVDAVSSGQDRIPVHIFPQKLSADGMMELQERFKENLSLLNFWKNLKEGYDIFEETHYLSKISVGRNGQYIFRI